uniref:Uncharacterized protein n=1 Tax=Arundo donax TaxID=35708 RepID=A0A0A9FXW1_ARUDO
MPAGGCQYPPSRDASKCMFTSLHFILFKMIN